MLDGIWRVYLADGTSLGRFNTGTGNDVLYLDTTTASKMSADTILHMDEVFTKRAWEVQITGNYRDNRLAFSIKKLGNRKTRYPAPSVVIQVVSRLS